MTRAELSAIGLAALLHVGGLAVARTFPAPSFVGRGDVRPLELVEIELPPSEALAPAAALAAAPLPAAIDHAIDPARPVDPSDPARPSAQEPGSAGPDEPGPTEPGPQVTAPGPGTTNPDEWSAPDGGGPGWAPPGLGPSGPLWAQPGMLDPTALAAAPAATTAPRAPRADRDVANKLLGDDLRERDKKLGLQLPAAGSVASIVKGAVYAADVPNEARGSIQVTLGPGGRVTGVRVLSSSGGDASTWNAIAQSVKASLGGAKLNLTGDYAKGATIVVNVQSKMQLPSGSSGDGGLEASLTQSFDVGDLGAKARRVVYTSFSASPIR